MKKLFTFLMVWFAGFLVLAGATKTAAAADYTDNQVRAENLLVEHGYSIDEAREDLQFMTISNEGELVGIDVFSRSEAGNVSPFRAAAPTTTQYLSHSAVRQIYSNLNAIDKGSYILGTLVGIKNPILGAVIGAGGFQNPNFRSAITKAYHQGKRVKIVTEYGSSMSLNKTYYYVVN